MYKRKKIIVQSTDLEVQIANEFSKIIRDWFTQEELDKINRENRERGYDNLICSTQDYSDANMAMDEAMEKCNVPMPSFYDTDIKSGVSSHALIEEHCDLWNRAWQISKEDEFGMKGLRKVLFNFADRNNYIGYAFIRDDGTVERWNGWANIAITKATWDKISEDNCIEPCDSCNDDGVSNRRYERDPCLDCHDYNVDWFERERERMPNGLISLASCFTCDIVEFID